MKLARIESNFGIEPVLVDPDKGYRSIRHLIGDLSGGSLEPDALRRLAGVEWGQLPKVSALRLLSCVGGVGKVIGVGMNYRDAARAMRVEPPSEPVLFLKASSAVAGPHDDLLLPSHAVRVDWEVELGVVIGRSMKDVSAADALVGVAGYCIVNDWSDRGWQLDQGGQWTKGKSHDGFAPLGPWLVTPEEVGDPGRLGLKLWVNDDCLQDGSTADMIFGVPELISYISRYMTLQPGDVIATGTPYGFGMSLPQPRFARDGDLIRASIQGLGEQRQRIRATPLSTADEKQTCN